MFDKTKIFRKGCSIRDKYKRWKTDVKVEGRCHNFQLYYHFYHYQPSTASQRSKYEKGTGGGPSYDEAYEDENFDEFIKAHKLKHNRSYRDDPSENSLYELMLCSLTKTDVEGFEGGFDTGSSQLEGIINNFLYFHQ
jgi:hypothetical protein